MGHHARYFQNHLSHYLQMLLVFTISLAGFDKQFFQGMDLEAASGNGALQLFFSKVSTTVLMSYQLHLTCMKD